jgi:hypothetical protein
MFKGSVIHGNIEFPATRRRLGRDVQALASCGKSLKYIPSQNGHLNLAELLPDAGADSDLFMFNWSRTPVQQL